MEKEVEEIRKLEQKVKNFNCLRLPGQGLSIHMGTSYLVNDLWRSIQALLTALSEKEGEIERLRQALGDIVDPISKFKRELKPGEQLDGMWCVRLSDNPHYLKGMAKDALEEAK